MAQFRRAARLDPLEVSEILSIGAKAAEMKRQGAPVIILGAGEPDFDTPDHIKEAAAAAMRAGETKYTPLGGTLALRQAIQAKFKRDNGLDYALDEIIAGTGAKEILFDAFMASLNPGDEVIVPTPYWTSYSDIIRIAGGEPVLVPCGDDTGFRLTAEKLEEAITPRARWLLLNSPSNPAGAGYSASDYQPLLEVLLRHPDVWLMADDMYEHITYGGFEFATPAQVEPRLKDRVLTVNGVSKAYAMTGWRLGYAGGPKALIDAMKVVQSQSTSHPSSISQAAAAAALNGPQEVLAERRASFQMRRDLVVEALNGMEGISCPVPEGAFYTFANCAGVLGKRTPEGQVLETDADFCAWLLDQHHVAVVPGRAFGISPYFRISYATSEAELREALSRIGKAVAALV
ncbi:MULTISPECIES: pyridoxal phosphate-dependent aminotransferase [unclassified Leisingera]|uniref:pyridoxal phosphate-dependent aminotransferase n=1 Tax=unclassified Leisingera TaxID=2614906 RepID=UPI0002E3EF3D|nr:MULTISPECIES: pyridoxal phosphate-dependent aminotransferase [unclassified Leisingera]KIC21929.1 aspartate aminotransferase [Leisingera sp. ANG-S3]KIC50252.1 aspartate aminotransferase [Leisingera sp. ANG-S]KID07616.1 aspartate aminotransferase [Leisingera sp. ANG1]